ncbi:hypothetical protein [Crenothrix polyspora]|uniref:hypothetical protein n=1 Tax=Crenothrix polyspora TaxID=360316 RepID=UPI000B353CA5|nr:hypothetical protein [Crenothrix polyspora]
MPKARHTAEFHIVWVRLAEYSGNIIQTLLETKSVAIINSFLFENAEDNRRLVKAKTNAKKIEPSME